MITCQTAGFYRVTGSHTYGAAGHYPIQVSMGERTLYGGALISASVDTAQHAPKAVPRCRRGRRFFGVLVVRGFFLYSWFLHISGFWTLRVCRAVFLIASQRAATAPSAVPDGGTSRLAGLPIYPSPTVDGVLVADGP